MQRRGQAVDTPAMWKDRARAGALVGIAGVSLYLLLPSLLAVFASWRSLSHLDWRFAVLVLACEAASFVCLWDLDRIALKKPSWFAIGTAQLSGNAVGRLCSARCGRSAPFRSPRWSWSRSRPPHSFL
jgi:hypothetical protein